MSNLSSINQMYIQQTLNPSTIQPIQNSPAPAVSPQSQANLSQKPDVFVSSKKSHRKAIIGAGAFLAAAAGLLILVRTGKLSFTGKEQGVNSPIPVPDEIIRIKDNVLASLSSIQEKGKALITQSKELQAKAEGIQTAAKKEFDEVFEIIQNGAANNFKETGSIRFVDRMNQKGNPTGQKIMEEFEGDKILRRTVFNPNNPAEQSLWIQKGLEKISGGERAAESFKYYDGKLYEYAINVEETKTYNKAAEIFDFNRKTDKLSSWMKDHFYSDKEWSQGEYIYFFDDGQGFAWKKDHKEVTDIISGIETKTETTGENMSLSYDENHIIKGYEKGIKRISEYHEDGVQSIHTIDEEYTFTNNLLRDWIKGFEMDKDDNQKRAYWLFFNENGTPKSCKVNEAGLGQQGAYYEF